MKNKIIIKSPMYAVVRNKENGFLVFESAVGSANEVYNKALRITQNNPKYDISLYLA